MFATLTIPSGISTQFLPANRLSYTGTSRSRCLLSSTARCPSRITVQAFAETTSRVYARKPANLYEVLRVKETASKIEIKTAYRSLAKQHHPDATPSESDGRDFMEIHEAYVTLTDPIARARYDLSIGAGRRFSYAAAGISSPGFAGVTRRWETDQCW